MSCTPAQPRTVRTINLKTGKEKRQIFLECHLISQYEETEDELCHYIITTEWLSNGAVYKDTSINRKDGRNPKTVINNWHSNAPYTRLREFRNLVLRYGTIYPFIDFAEVARLLELGVRAEWYSKKRNEACILEVRTTTLPLNITHKEEFVLFENGWNEHQDKSAWTVRYN